MSRKLIATLLGTIIVSACQTTNNSSDPFGNVEIVSREEVVSEDSGEVSVVTTRKNELAEKSLADKGSESLMPAQRVASPGSYFGAISISSSDAIAVSVLNPELEGADIWMLNKNGGKTRLTNTSYFNISPTYSPNDDYIYFSSSRGRLTISPYDQKQYVWRMKANGSGGITRIGTPVFHYSGSINQSPSGDKLLFSAKDLIGSSDFIWYMNSNGALPTQLAKGFDPNWLGKDSIVFAALDEATGLSTIWTMNMDGTLRTQIISDPEKDVIHPSPSPDGKHIAYVMQAPDKPDTRDIYIYEIESGLSVQITTNRSRDDIPSWSSDGEHLYFRSSRGVDWNIWRVAIGSNSTEQPKEEKSEEVIETMSSEA